MFVINFKFQANLLNIKGLREKKTMSKINEPDFMPYLLKNNYVLTMN